MSPCCWFCDAAIGDAHIEREGVLLPRETALGGPLWILSCPECSTENGAERNGAGAFLLVPREPPGLTGILGAVLDPRRTVVRAHARRWFRDNAALRRAFHAVPMQPRPRADTTAGESPPPPPEPEIDSTGDEVELPARAGETVGILEHYRRLDVPLTATEAEVTSAYRLLSQRCHPDKVAHLDEEFQKLANRKFRELREAYEIIVAGLRSNPSE